MTKFIYPTLLALLIVGLSILYYFHFSSPSMVYVDSSRIINHYQGMVDARETYQQKSATWKGNIDTLAIEVQKAIKEYEKESLSMTEKEKMLSQELIRSKQQQLAQFQRAIKEKAAQEDSEMTAKVVKQINAYIKRYGDEQGLKIIFAATEYGNIAYAQEGSDITDEIIEGLNKEYNGQ